MKTANQTFHKHWQAFLARCKPGLFSDADRSLAFAFYCKGWLDGTGPIVEAAQLPSDLGDLLPSKDLDGLEIPTLWKVP
jgi:hypothetical protein